MQNILRRRPTRPEEIESIEVTINDFLTDMVPFHAPQTGLEAKYSLEYDVAVIALDGRAGLHQYSDDAIRRPEVQQLMRRVTTVGAQGPLGSRVVVKLTNGEELEETVSQSHGTPADPLTRDEILGKFHECAGALVSEAQRTEVIELCARLDSLESVRELTDAIATVQA